MAGKVGETACMFLAGLYRAEQAIADRLIRIVNGRLPWTWIDEEKAACEEAKMLGRGQMRHQPVAELLQHIHLVVRETEFCGLRLAGYFRRRMRENSRNSVRRPRCASLTRRNYGGFCLPGNRPGLSGLHGGGRSPAEPVSGGASPGAPAKIPWNA